MTVKKAQYQFLLINFFAFVLILAATRYSLLSWSAAGVVAIANVFLFGLTLYLFRRTIRSFSNPNPQASIRAIMSGFMIKFFSLALTSLLYILYMKKEVSLPALGLSAVLYVLYAAAEIRALLILLKSTDHA